jgi:hypothetical protein
MKNCTGWTGQGFELQEQSEMVKYVPEQVKHIHKFKNSALLQMAKNVH